VSIEILRDDAGEPRALACGPTPRLESPESPAGQGEASGRLRQERPVCPCGCGRPVPPRARGSEPKWATGNCRRRASDRKKYSAQLPLGLEPPKGPSTLSSFHVRSEMPVAEALAGQERASRQDARVLAVFRARPLWAWTPSQVHAFLCEETGPAPLLTSIRRSITNLTRRGLLAHHPEDRRMGPHGAKESTWTLEAQP
jgi:hypothetical protein